MIYFRSLFLFINHNNLSAKHYYFSDKFKCNNKQKFVSYKFIFFLLGVFLSNIDFVFGQCTTKIEPPKAIIATIEGSRPAIKILDYQVGTLYRIYRSKSNESSFEEIGRSQLSQYSDADITIDPNTNSYCYYVKVEDACGNLSEPSPIACTMLLKGVGNGLSWNSPLQNSTLSVNYEVLLIDNSLVAVSDTIKSTHYFVKSQNDNETYLIKANVTMSINGQTFQVEVYSNNYDLVNLLVYIPDMFTPNNDGVNDNFEIFSVAINTFQMTIFDRWGKTVFHTNDFRNSWDGSLPNGEAALPGVYVYKMIYTDLARNTWSKLGQVHLMR